MNRVFITLILLLNILFLTGFKTNQNKILKELKEPSNPDTSNFQPDIQQNVTTPVTEENQDNTHGEYQLEIYEYPLFKDRGSLDGPDPADQKITEIFELKSDSLDKIHPHVTVELLGPRWPYERKDQDEIGRLFGASSSEGSINGWEYEGTDGAIWSLHIIESNQDTSKIESAGKTEELLHELHRNGALVYSFKMLYAPYLPGYTRFWGGIFQKTVWVITYKKSKTETRKAGWHTVKNGVDLCDLLGYDSIHGYTLINDKPFFFVEKDGKVGWSYSDEINEAVWDRVLDYSGDGSYIWTYPRKYSTGIVFQAQRDGWWYLCKTILKEKE
ncbi:MAG: hypothetical protein P9L92_13045 [Candidatus Electryonea clarkiae]|nr:hypothetical protein [Candidatus Electryonea clarkiae]MDP8286449.1 hypothetical protein [Candidatus Electryonea clarkiae]